MSKKKKKIDWGLRFYRDVLGLENLHLGLWEDDYDVTLVGARKAQENYTRVLIDMIPDGCNDILDVGCGTGVTAQILKNKDYNVECVNPDEHQENLFKERLGSSVEFNRVKFEDFMSETKYNLILMSESSQYMDPGILAQKASAHLKPGGYLLIADYFRKNDTPFYKSCKVKKIFYEQIEKYFLVENDIDISENVLKNLTLGKKVFSSYGLPVVDMIKDYLTLTYPKLSGSVAFVLRKKISKVQKYLYKKMPEKLDEEKFIKEMEYRFILFRLKAEG